VKFELLIAGGTQEMTYIVRKIEGLQFGDDAWSSKAWKPAQTALVDHFHPRSSLHRPVTKAKIMHDDQNIYVAFQVEDQFVRCVNDRYQSFVYQDSCVEFFVEPRPDAGYFNFEVNCGGAMLLYYIEDPAPEPQSLFRKFCEVPAELGHQVRIRASLPNRVEPEITDPVMWTVQIGVPRAVFEAFLGPLGDWGGKLWRGNLFKCGDHTSHPHWASWAPIGEELRFHDPGRFAAILMS
jgi:hypothetical protein